MTKTHEPPLAEGESKLVDAVLNEIENAFEQGDVQAVDELLRFCPRINLIQYLPEEQWNQFATEEELDVIYNYSKEAK